MAPRWTGSRRDAATLAVDQVAYFKLATPSNRDQLVALMQALLAG